MSQLETKNRALEAHAFLELANVSVDDSRPGYFNVSASNAILAGIAASDAICGHALLRASQGESHAQAIALLTSVSASAAKHLTALLDAKTTTQYGTSYITAARAKSLLTHAERLCQEMSDRLSD